MAFPESRPSEIRNRIEAVRRVPDYQKDFSQWIQLAERVKAKKRPINTDLAALSACEQAIRERWKVRPPFPPPASVPFDQWERLRFIYPLEGLMVVEEISPFDINRQMGMSELVKGYDPIRLETDYESFRQKHGNRKVIFKGGKHLCLIVDVTGTETEILREFRGYLKYYKRMLPKNKSRKKPTTVVDIWQVYDQNQNGDSVQAITEQLLSKIGPRPHVADPYAAMYNAVKRGLQKAKEMIAALP